ncbi:hypothetical protein LCGC14_0636140 [marine sediment metagenome]|uniref:Polymerase beta nucleotidyltransferase domain-containing protein n=1 Tax=marine sediment metagenome TaxID=412755 RepID=A0A0F9TM05_9ZZZZ|nr:hypothetical protein [bacterium]
MPKRKYLFNKYKKFKKDIIIEFSKRNVTQIVFELFGSILTKKKLPNDVDILIIIPKVSYKKFSHLRKLLIEIENKVKYQNTISSYLINGKHNKFSKYNMVVLSDQKVRGNFNA